MNYTGLFTYNTDNLLFEPHSLLISIIAIFGFIALLFLARQFLLGIVGLYWLSEDKKMIANRKKMLADLVIMKDIQTELEKEIEQATLKAAFQS